MKKNINKKKLMTFVIVGLLGLVVVNAAILTYYEKYVITVDVNQPLSFSDNLIQDVDCDAGETCLGEPITVTNEGDIDLSVFITDISSLGIDISYVGEMQFTHKDLQTGVWSGITEEVVYTITGESFVATGIPEGYELIYYPDTAEGWNTNLANILVYGEDSFPSLPILLDIGDDYCNIKTLDDSTLANPEALVCSGAKLWLVEDDYVDALIGGSWLPDKILFETDLMTYTESTDGKVLVPAKSMITIYPQFDVSQYIEGGDKTVYLTIA